MKEKILSAAVKVFNECGITKTTFRNVAASLNLSDGHVRYYFKTKEELLLAAFDKMNDEIMLFAEKNPEENKDMLQNLKSRLNSAFSVMADYSFFFTETPATYRQFPKLAVVYTELVKNRKELFIITFRKLKAQGFFNESFSDELQEKAFYGIFILSDSWIRYYTIVSGKRPDSAVVEFHSDIAFSILLPYIKM